MIDLLLLGQARGVGLLLSLQSNELYSRIPVVILISKELSPDEMTLLENALESAAMSGDTDPAPVPEIIKAALNRATESPVGA